MVNYLILILLLKFHVVIFKRNVNVCFKVVAEDPSKLEMKKLEISGKSQQQLGQVVQQSNNLHPSRDYFTAPVPSVPSVPTVPSASMPLSSLQVTTAGVQIQADVSTGLQITPTQPLPRSVISAFEAGLNLGMQTCISEENFQSSLLLQSQLSKFRCKNKNA